MIYMIGMIFAFILGFLLFKYQEINPLQTYDEYDEGEGEELQIAVLAPLTLLSWLTVVVLLIFRYDEIQQAWEYLKLKK